MQSSVIKNIKSILNHPWFTRIYFLAISLFVGSFLLSHRQDFTRILQQADINLLLLSAIPYLLVIGLLNPYLHSVAYRELGADVSFWQAFRIFHLSRIGNYLPGRVWFATNYYLFSKKLQITTEKIAKNFVVLNILLLMVGSLCCIPAFLLFEPRVRNVIVLSPLVFMGILHPRIFNMLARIISKNTSSQYYSFRFLLEISCIYFIAYVLLGCAFYLCALAFIRLPLSSLPLMTAVASSFVISVLVAFFAPAGIGVGEGISMIILTRFMSINVALMVVLSLRIIMVAADFFCAFISMASIRQEEKTQSLSSNTLS